VRETFWITYSQCFDDIGYKSERAFQCDTKVSERLQHAVQNTNATRTLQIRNRTYFPNCTRF